MAGSGAPQRRPVHGRPGHRDRERRAALDPGRPRVLSREPPVGDQRLRARLRRLPAPGRTGGRPARTPAHLPPRRRRLHARLPARRAGVVGDVADRSPRAPGARRGDHHAGRALDPLHHLRRRARPQHRARRVGRRRRLRCRRGRAARRHPHGRPQLGVDLLRQHPRRRRRLRAGAGPPRREPRRAREDVRPPRRGARDRRALAARLRDHRGRPRRLAGRPDDRVLRDVARPPRRASSAGSSGTPSRSCASGSCAPRR